MAKTTSLKSKTKRIANNNLLGNIELDQNGISQIVTSKLQDIIDSIQNSFTVTPRNPHAEIPNGAINLIFLGSKIVSASGTFASWEDGGISKKEKEFKLKSLLLLLPNNRKFQTVIKINNTSTAGTFFIEKEINRKRILLKKIVFDGKKVAFINFLAETDGSSDSQSFYISFREKNDSNSRYKAWEMKSCICTEIS